MNIAELIEQKISEGKDILEGLSSMRERSGMAINVTYYVAEDVQSAIRKINRWQLTCKDILINGFGESHRYTKSFEKTITAKNSGFNFRREFEHEMNEGLSVLEGVSESLKLGLDGSRRREDVGGTGQKPPMVFISHSSKDKYFADALVVLLEDIGFDSSNLFCSSIDGYGVGLSEDIFDTLRSLFNEHDLYVIFIHSPRYYESAVSLNEMGAAWVLKTDFCSLLTTDMEFSNMSGVVNDSKISIKVDNNDAPARLTELKDKLISLFGLKAIDAIKWERKRQVFLDRVTSIKNDAKAFDDKKKSLRKGYADPGPA